LRCAPKPPWHSTGLTNCHHIPEEISPQPYFTLTNVPLFMLFFLHYVICSYYPFSMRFLLWFVI